MLRLLPEQLVLGTKYSGAKLGAGESYQSSAGIDAFGEKRQLGHGRLLLAGYNFAGSPHPAVNLRASAVSDLEVDRGGRQFGVAELLCRVRDVDTFIRKVRSQGVPEHMRMPQVGRQSRGSGVAPKQRGDRASGQGHASVAEPPKQVGTAVLRSNREIASQQRDAAREHLIPERPPSFQTPDEDSTIYKVFDTKERRLAASKSMEIHEVDQQPVTDVFLWNRSKKRAQLLLRQELDVVD